MKKEMKRGRALVVKMKERMAIEGASVSDLAVRLEVSQSYLSQLLSGDKALASVSDALIRRISGYVYLPPVVCFVLSGKLEVDDFADCKYDEELRKLERRAALIADSTFALEAGVTREALLEADPRVLSMLIGMYQAMLGAGEMIARNERWSWLGKNS